MAVLQELEVTNSWSCFPGEGEAGAPEGGFPLTATATGTTSVFWGETPISKGVTAGLGAAGRGGLVGQGQPGSEGQTHIPAERSESSLLFLSCSFAKLFPIL